MNRAVPSQSIIRQTFFRPVLNGGQYLNFMLNVFLRMPSILRKMIGSKKFEVPFFVQGISLDNTCTLTKKVFVSHKHAVEKLVRHSKQNITKHGFFLRKLSTTTVLHDGFTLPTPQ